MRRYFIDGYEVTPTEAWLQEQKNQKLICSDDPEDWFDIKFITVVE